MSRIKRRIIGILWILFIAGWTCALLSFYLIARGVIGYMPDIEQLQNPIDKYASQLISSDGKLLGSYARSGNNRLYTLYKDLSPNLVNALIATEDKRFFQHNGIDTRALARAIVKRGIFMSNAAGGGSTITQQLAKQLYSPHAANAFERIFQKPIEWVIAIKLEREYTKEEIISMYLNQFDFLYNAVGVSNAANTYFSKSPKELNIQEAATLVGMCNNPSYFNPVLHDDTSRCVKRRNFVLKQMMKAGMLSEKELDSIRQLPLEIRFKQISHVEGYAPYFREHLRLMLTAKKPERDDYSKWNMAQYALDSAAWVDNPMYGWCAKNKKADGSSYDLYEDGLKIYTSVNSTMQKYAEEAMKQHIGEYAQPLFFKEIKNSPLAPYARQISKQEREELIERAIKQTDRYARMKKAGATQAEINKAFNTRTKMRLWSWNGFVDTVMTPKDSVLYYKSFLRSSFFAMNPHNGYVLAYVGGIDFRTFKYDMVYTGRRQVGSTIKPFLYSLIMNEGATPCDTLLHEPITLYDDNGRPWTPRSGGARRQGEYVTIRWGLQNSSNWVTAALMGRTRPQAFVNLLHGYGITGYIDPVISIAIGTPEVSLYEMVSAYTTFVAKGIRVNPLPITRIEDRYGNVLATFAPRMAEVLPEDTALKMLDMLQAVVNGGTAGRLRGRYQLSMPLGGKTGTTQRNSDAWFIGFSPEIVAGCWVGGDERSIHFNSTALGQGASLALPVFGLFMQKVYGDSSLGYDPKEKFDIPEGWSPCAHDSSYEQENTIVYQGDVPSLDEGDEVNE